MIGRLVAETVLDDLAIQGLIHSDQVQPTTCHNWSNQQNSLKSNFQLRWQHEKVREDNICMAPHKIVV